MPLVGGQDNPPLLLTAPRRVEQLLVSLNCLPRRAGGSRTSSVIHRRKPVGQWDKLFAFRDAAMRGDLAAMREVLAGDSSFLADENPNDLPLHYLAKTYQVQTAAREGPLERVRQLISDDPRLVRQAWTVQGWLPLSQAVWGDQLATVRLLLSCGASGDDRIAEGGGTVLQMAAELDRVEMARLMMEAGADPRAQAPDGTSPIGKAKSQEMREALTRGRGEAARG
jgi:hypothetical protein